MTSNFPVLNPSHPELNEKVTTAVMNALGDLAPSGPLEEYLRECVAVVVQRVRADRESFLDVPQREALILGICEARAKTLDDEAFSFDIVANGYWGLTYATDEALIEEAASLSLDDLVSARSHVVQSFGRPFPGKVVVHVDEVHKAAVISALTHPRSLEILEAIEDPSDQVLLDTLNDELAVQRPRG